MTRTVPVLAHTDLLDDGKFYGNTIAELEKSLADLQRWAENNEKSAAAFARSGAPLEEAMMRNAAEEQRKEIDIVCGLIAERALKDALDVDTGLAAHLGMVD